jgi:hypothetical protein
MWQGVQDQFRDANNQPCQMRIAIAMGDQATCFVASDGNLHCAGQLDTHDFGTTFVDTGISGVQQILMSPTFNAPNHDSLCVAKDQGAECWGSANDWGQFGDGNENAAPNPVSWGTVDVHRLATGTWDQICGLTSMGEAYCAGYSFGELPLFESGGHQSLFVDTSGMVNLDDAGVLRAVNSRTEATVTPNGFESQGVTYGAPGKVVDGTVQGMVFMAPPMGGRGCWLDDTGHVTCFSWSLGPPMANPMTWPMFQAQPVLALAGNFYSDGLCAVYADGSVACIGSNTHGELGTGDHSPLSVETVVAPPGSLDVTCQ